ncbi:NACHT domain-containing protein [Lusitaniella coriacea LEGE 07157]|uniref:NACHT domain-containing protein n=1 Tax=Lusitaniella coriacea LEGE 07157 TaxID=945747 RepID=A0A8J7IW33_9CYAN|nr:NACHT domain-containing protein [Lusitaniella coriacea]MBE9117733.1 NACHT domain-containing protein [Lusitaniella coriacea LEGE 07157]
MSRTTVTKFFNEQPIGERSFRKICLVLRLKWQDLSSVESISEIARDRSSTPSQLDEEKIREHCRQKILNQHSRMRLLSGEEIGVDQLYVDVYLLAKPENKHFNLSDSILENYDIKNDRLALSKRIQRNPGFEIANTNSKLVILGKPGSGKTTFLKHLAVDWCNGKFQAELIAMLIELRQIRDEQWNLWLAVDEALEIDPLYQFSALKIQIDNLGKHPTPENRTQISELKQQLESLPLQHLLNQGKLLILMDGLDEVPTDALRTSVKEQIRQFSKEYTKNRLILTCRTQIMEVIPSGFTSVEVADFRPEQVKQFVFNWFKASGNSDIEAKKKWGQINRVITNQPDFKELTATPVLLNLICLVLQDNGRFYSNRAELYKKGIKLLLSRWNEEKQINGWKIGIETYRKLDIEDKEVLLIEIAARKFENPNNFVLFEEEELADQITQQLQLANQQEGVSVLRAIEAQHGLLIERADGLWSFSHLTFQEYFTVRWLTQLSSKRLAEKIANRRWQEVVQQLVASQQPADQLLQLIKQAIEQSIAHELVVQTFLRWLLQKSKSTYTKFRSVAIRAFHCALALIHTFELEGALDPILALDSALNLIRILNYNCTLALDNALVLDRTLTYILALALSRDPGVAFFLDFTLNPNLSSALNPNLIHQLRELRKVLPESDNQEYFQQWWSDNSSQWIEQLRQVMIEHRNIGHDWQFTKEQKQQLQRYYDANKFLVELMQIEGAVSESVRAEIEDALLLPWEELKRRQPGIYDDLE